MLGTIFNNSRYLSLWIQRELNLDTFYYNTICISHSCILHQWSAESLEMGLDILLQRPMDYIIVPITYYNIQ